MFYLKICLIAAMLCFLIEAFKPWINSDPEARFKLFPLVNCMVLGFFFLVLGYAMTLGGAKLL